MSPATLRRYRAERLLSRDFDALRTSVLSIVTARLRAGGATLDRAELEGCYASAWQGLYGAALAGEQVANPRAWLALVTYRRAIEELRAPRRREEPLPEISHAGPDLDADLDAREELRGLLVGMRERMDLREREAAALCYLHGYSRGEAARLMGLSETRMRKLMEGSKGRAGVSAKVAEIAESIRSGSFCAEHASLMRAFALGLLDPDGERYQLAVAHRRDCPGCRSYVVALRGAAALLPPVLTLPGAAVRGLAALAGLPAHAAAGPAAAPIPSLGASAATGGAGAGGWALGGPLAAKLAVGCVLAVGLGAGCVAIEHGVSGGAARSPGVGVRAPLHVRAEARTADTLAIPGPGAARPSVRLAAAPSQPAPAPREFSIEQPAGEAEPQPSGERAHASSLARRSPADPVRSAPAPTQDAAALREFSPG